MFLLDKIGLTGKRLRKNARGETNSLSFRDLARLCLVSEGNIRKEGSLIETGQFISRTSEFSTFKLLLTGIDDSAVEPEGAQRTRQLSRSAKIEVIDELIAENKDRLTALVGEDHDEDELQDQLDRLDDSLSRERNSLRQSEQTYREAVQKRNRVRHEIEKARDRRSEIDELLERFSLLDTHYELDLQRLEGIREAGVLVSSFDTEACPLCGAYRDSQHLDGDCDGNVDAVIAAADAESTKIERLREELRETVAQLNDEAREFDRLTPRMNEQLELTLEELNELNPSLSTQRAAYSVLLERKSSVQAALNILTTITELEGRKAELEETPNSPPKEEQPAVDLSSSTLNDFSKTYEAVLKAWNFPDAERVYFDRNARDFVINGKPRGARGKGMRALTHAAFSVSLLEFAHQNNLPHPGFLVLDTPLLAYREPEGDEDDLSGTDVHEQFYEYLNQFVDRQFIILENVDPPADIRESGQATFFSGKSPFGTLRLLPNLADDVSA